MAKNQIVKTAGSREDKDMGRDINQDSSVGELRVTWDISSPRDHHLKIQCDRKNFTSATLSVRLWRDLPYYTVYNVLLLANTSTNQEGLMYLDVLFQALLQKMEGQGRNNFFFIAPCLNSTPGPLVSATSCLHLMPSLANYRFTTEAFARSGTLSTFAIYREIMRHEPAPMDQVIRRAYRDPFEIGEIVSGVS